MQKENQKNQNSEQRLDILINLERYTDDLARLALTEPYREKSYYQGAMLVLRRIYRNKLTTIGRNDLYDIQRLLCDIVNFPRKPENKAELAKTTHRFSRFIASVIEQMRNSHRYYINLVGQSEQDTAFLCSGTGRDPVQW